MGTSSKVLSYKEAETIAGTIYKATKEYYEERIKKLESALKQCVDDPIFKIHFTVKYQEFKKLLEIE